MSILKKLFTTEDLSIWRQMAEAKGLKVTMGEEVEVGEPEWFAESDDDDTTMVGYFKDDWGMLL